MDVLARLRCLMDERGWTKYRLAKNSGLSESTITNILKRDTMPSIPTLKAICDCMGISLSQFFAEDEMVELTPELKEIFDCWVNLTPEQKLLAAQLLKTLSHESQK